MDERLSPESLRRQFRMSRATLYRLFEDEDGVAAYILGRRLDRCRALLAADVTGGRTIGEIAFGHGFASDAHFSRAFRRRFGMTPRDVRGTHIRIPAATTTGMHAGGQTISDWIATLRRQHLRLSST